MNNAKAFKRLKQTENDERHAFMKKLYWVNIVNSMTELWPLITPFMALSIHVYAHLTLLILTPVYLSQLCKIMRDTDTWNM